MKNLILIIANCRGKKPVLRDIKRARDIINGLMIEMNDSEGKEALNECASTLTQVIAHNTELNSKIK